MLSLLNTKKPPIEIAQGISNKDGTEVRYNISLDEKSYNIYFHSSDVPLYSGVEPLLVLALLPAMRLGADLVHSQPICRDLSDNLIRFMEIFGGWFKEYRQVNILGERRDPEPPINNGRVGVFFSGGVDSFYTLFKHQNEITDLICVHGFDVSLKDKDRALRKVISDMCRIVADHFGKNLVEVETNARHMLHYGKWGEHLHGAALGSIAHLLSSEFNKIYLASSFDHDKLFPWGSHPDIDPLLGSLKITLVHDGCEVTRTQKIETLCEHKIAMDHLRVCYTNVENYYNCGKCEKCLRTMITFEALGKPGICRTLPEKIDTAALRNILFTDESGKIFAQENLALLEERGLRDSPVYSALQTAISRPLWLVKLFYYYGSRKRKIGLFISRISAFFGATAAKQ